MVDFNKAIEPTMLAVLSEKGAERLGKLNAKFGSFLNTGKQLVGKAFNKFENAQIDTAGKKFEPPKTRQFEPDPNYKGSKVMVRPDSPLSKYEQAMKNRAEFQQRKAIEKGTNRLIDIWKAKFPDFDKNPAAQKAYAIDDELLKYRTAADNISKMNWDDKDDLGYIIDNIDEELPLEEQQEIIGGMINGFNAKKKEFDNYVGGTKNDKE